MIIDGTDLVDIGLVVGTRPGGRSGPSIRDPFAEIPGANQARRLGRGTIGPKTITLTGIVEAATIGALRTNLDKLAWYLRPQDSHTLEWSDDSTREYVVYFSDLIVNDFDPGGWVQPYAKVEVIVKAEDPRGRATSATDVNSAGALPRTLTPTAMGTAPMPVIITVTGSSTNVTSMTIAYRNSADATVSSFSWDGTDLTASDTLVIDTGLATVERNSVNDVASITDANGALPFDMDPDDGDYLTSSYPDIYITGTGTANTCKITYRERWW